MSKDMTNWGELESRSLVRESAPVALHYVPEIAEELENYTWGNLEARSVVRTPVPADLHPVRPYVKLTLAFEDESKVTAETDQEDRSGRQTFKEYIQSALAGVEGELRQHPARPSEDAMKGADRFSFETRKLDVEIALAKLKQAVVQFESAGIRISFQSGMDNSSD